MRVLILSLLLLINMGCTSKKIRTEVKEEMSQTQTVNSDSELYSIENKILLASENLTTDQRSKLSALILKMKNENLAIDNEIMKTKALLFQTLVQEDSSKAKLNILESQLLKLNRKKVKASLGAYREAKNIVGKNEVPLDKTLRMIDNRTIHEF